MKKNKHIGSSFDDFLKEEGILEEVKETALKRVMVFLMRKAKKLLKEKKGPTNH